MRVVIMGGTSGIGVAYAEKLTADGAEVIVTGRDAEKLAAVKDRVAGAEKVDDASESAVTEFFERIGSFDHLVLAFSPGALGLGPLAGVNLADIKGAFDGKLFPYLFALQKAQVTGSVTMVSAATVTGGSPWHGDVRGGQRRHPTHRAAAGRRAVPGARQRRGARCPRHAVAVVPV
ncbi:SDR family NAD(P)-dependent oxidoreductase [Streptomyces mirabilis]|uniref:SDR family NAD(P)-dependent oxidoreductase n=1 Tax=Streptomyces mirabilis TaxID=68239 RepID=UPI00369D359A